MPTPSSLAQLGNEEEGDEDEADRDEESETLGPGIRQRKMAIERF